MATKPTDIAGIGRTVSEVRGSIHRLEARLAVREDAYERSSSLPSESGTCTCGCPSEHHNVFSGECLGCDCRRYASGQGTNWLCEVCLSPHCPGHRDTGGTDGDL